jgi:hypothetical protein
MFGWRFFKRSVPSIRQERLNAIKAVREAEFREDDRDLGRARMVLSEVLHRQLRQGQ